MQEVAEPGLFDLFLQMFCSFEIVFKTEELKKKNSQEHTAAKGRGWI